MDTSQAAGPDEDSPDELFPISLEMYEAMIEHGLLMDGEKIELLDGLLVKKMSKSPRHVLVTHQVRSAITAALPGRYFAMKEDPISLPDGPRGDSVPEPDVSVIVGEIREYRDHHPRADATRLVIQVADTSLERDRRGLERLAWAGIPCAWIVNLQEDVLEIYTGPTGRIAAARYAEKTVKNPGDTFEFTLDDTRVGPFAVSDFLA